MLEVVVEEEEYVEDHVEEDQLEVQEEEEEEDAEEQDLHMEEAQDTPITARISKPPCAVLVQARPAIQDHSNAAASQPREFASQFQGGCQCRWM